MWSYPHCEKAVPIFFDDRIWSNFLGSVTVMRKDDRPGSQFGFRMASGGLVQILPETAHPKKPFIRHIFSLDEDERLRDLIDQHGCDWNLISRLMPCRNARQVKERWVNYLAPEKLNAPWTPEEDNLLREKFCELGPKWRKISESFPTRSEINVKNRFRLLQRACHREVRRIQKAIMPSRPLHQRVQKPPPPTPPPCDAPQRPSETVIDNLFYLDFLQLQDDWSWSFD